MLAKFLLITVLAILNSIASSTASAALTDFKPITQAQSQYFKSGWAGELELSSPTEARARGDGGVWFTPQLVPSADQAHLVGRRIWLKIWGPLNDQWFRAMEVDVSFTDAARTELANNLVLPLALSGRSRVSFLQSLAGARSQLAPEFYASRANRAQYVQAIGEPVKVELVGRVDLSGSERVDERTNEYTLEIRDEPVQISGFYRAMVTFERKIENCAVRDASGDPKTCYVARHWNSRRQDFSGDQVEVEINQYEEALLENTKDSSTAITINGIENSPLNSTGWLIYGKSVPTTGRYVVEALEPVQLTKLSAVKRTTPIAQNRLAQFLQSEHWDRAALSESHHAIRQFRTGTDTAFDQTYSTGSIHLVAHIFGADDVHTKLAVPFIAPQGIVSGHFSYGFAQITPHPFIEGEKYIDITYKQVFAHNARGILSGSVKWHEYNGNLRRGLMYTKPISDALIPMPELSTPLARVRDLESQGEEGSPFLVSRIPLNLVGKHLEKMMGSYRLGFGSGWSRVTPVTSCVQDSNLAVNYAIHNLRQTIVDGLPVLRLFSRPQQEQRVLQIADNFQSLFGLSIGLSGLRIFERLYSSSASWRPEVDRELWQRREIGLDAAYEIHQRSASLFPRLVHDGFIRQFAGNQPVTILQTVQIGGEIPALQNPLGPEGLDQQQYSPQVLRRMSEEQELRTEQQR